MKNYFKGLVLGILSILMLGACASSDDSLNGTYEASNDSSTLSLEIDGNDALLSLYGRSAEGVVNKKDQTIIIEDDDDTQEFSYKIIGDKLSLKSEETGTIALKKISDKKENATDKSSREKNKNSSTSSEENEQYKYDDYFSLSTGEYEVGSDIKPEAYNIDFNFYDFSDESKEHGSGYIEVTHNANVKKYEFSDDNTEQRIILKDGDLVNIVSGNSDSDFSFSIDKGY